MNQLENFHFLRPLWLLAIPLAVGLWWLARKANDPLRGWRNSMDPELLNAVTLGRDHRDRWKGVSTLAIAVLSSFGVAGPAWRLEPSPFSDDPAPVLVVLKADESMELSDIAPSRLERAHLKITDFAEARKGKPLGLLGYAGSSHLVLPPTRDTGVVATMASNLSPDVIPKPGDDLVGALILARQTLAATGGSIVLVADDTTAFSDNDLARLKVAGSQPVHLLAIARADTPELDALQATASALKGSLTLMTADSSDINELVRRTAKAPVMIAANDDASNRWAEDGWWIVPLIALLFLISFRKQQHLNPTEAAA